MSYNGKFVLVTGGAGYIGSTLVPRLLRRGYRVRVFDKLIFGDDGLADVKDQVDIVQGDICTFDKKVLEDIDHVIHLAGLSNDPTAEYNPKANHLINVEGTKNVAASAKAAGIKRFLFASSCSVYYSFNPYEGILDETSETSPTAPYSVSKKLGEDYLRSIADEKFCPTFLRKGTIFGYSPKMRYDLVVNVFCRDAWQKGRLAVNGGGEIWRPLLSVGDAADAYVNALELPPGLINSEAFNVSHKNYRVLELAHWIKFVLRDHRDVEVDVNYAGQGASRSYQVSMEKFHKTFGYLPCQGISNAALEMWQCFKNGVATDFDNPEYYNIKWFKLVDSMYERLNTIGPLFPEDKEIKVVSNAA